MLNFTEGVIYGTELIENTHYMDSCIHILRHNFIIKGEQVYNNTLDIKIFDALFGFYDIVWSIHPLFLDCRLAPNNVDEVVLDRFNEPDDGKVMTVNFIQNYADIVDSYRAVQDFFQSDDRGVSDEAPYDIGFGAGRIVHYIFRENTEFEEPVDPAADADFSLFG